VAGVQHAGVVSEAGVVLDRGVAGVVVGVAQVACHRSPTVRRRGMLLFSGVGGDGGGGRMPRVPGMSKSITGNRGSVA